MTKIAFFIYIFFTTNCLGVPLYNNIIPDITISINNEKQNILICNDANTSLNKQLFEGLNNPKTTKQFYNNYCKNSSKFVWLNDFFLPNYQGFDLMEAIEKSTYHGLNPQKYHTDEIKSNYEAIKNRTFATVEEKNFATARLDILLTNAYISLALDLYYGTTDWEKFIQNKQKEQVDINNTQVNGDTVEELESEDDKIKWERGKKNPLGIVKYLQDKLNSNSIKTSLLDLCPTDNEYFRLADIMTIYGEIEKNGGWGRIDVGKNIKPNDLDDRIPAIKKRLFLSGDLGKLQNIENKIYNEQALINAIKLFQKRHNQAPTGVVTNETIGAFNIPVKARMDTISLNMERFRWMSRENKNDKTHIVVNIPSFEMKLFEENDEAISMKVIVGQTKRPTPVFNENMKYIVVNPTWTVPPSIIEKDILAKKIKPINYFKSHDIKVYVVNKNKKIEVDPNLIEWSNFKNNENFPFEFIANPGKKNPLGEVKFIFPNKYAVYMHDTNRRDLFAKKVRTFSSGCIRLGEPQKLLAYLLKRDNQTIKQDDTDQKDDKVLDEKVINIGKKIPVFIRYLTATVDKYNHISFYDDIYGYDAHQMDISK